MRTTRQTHKAQAKTEEKRGTKRAARARGLEWTILLDVANGWWAPGARSPVSQERINDAIQRCREKGWLSGRRTLVLTESGKEAAGLVLREVPLPTHLANLVRPGIKTWIEAPSSAPKARKR